MYFIACSLRISAYSVLGRPPTNARNKSPGVVSALTRRRAQQPADDDDDHIPDELSRIGRREFMMQSVVGAALGAEFLDADGRTVLNSILGAYGLPKVTSAKGFRTFDDFEEVSLIDMWPSGTSFAFLFVSCLYVAPARQNSISMAWPIYKPLLLPPLFQEYYFDYPTSWVRRKNSLRSGVYISNFQTADKLSVESFPLGNDFASSEISITSSTSTPFLQAVVDALLNPGSQAGGDSRIELPSMSKVKTRSQEIDGRVRHGSRLHVFVFILTYYSWIIIIW